MSGLSEPDTTLNAKLTEDNGTYISFKHEFSECLGDICHGVI